MTLEEGSIALPSLAMEPYRSRSAHPETRRSTHECAWDLAIGLGLLFVASLARVVGAVVQGETFGTEASLALLVVLLSAAWAIKHLGQALEG